MPANTTGNPNPDDYLLGRGRVYLAELDLATGLPGAYRDVGNATKFEASVSGSSLKHKSSRSGVVNTDREVTISQEVSVNLSLDEINNENLSVFFSGRETTYNNPADSAISVAQVIVATAAGAITAALGKWFELKNAAGNRIFDLDATKVTVVTTESTPVTLVRNTDYILDTRWGLIQFISTSSALATAATANKGVNFTTTAMSTARDVDVVEGLTQTPKAVAIKFISVNSANGEAETEYSFWRVKLQANGQFGLISDNWGEMQFTGTAQTNPAAGGVTSPTCTIRTIHGEFD